MRQHDLDLVVLSSEANVVYFTGYGSMMWPSFSRPMFAIITQEDLRFVASRIEERNLTSAERPFSWALYDGFLREALAALVAECSGVARAPATIGLDYGEDMFGLGSLALLERLREWSPRSRLVEAAAALWMTRRVKSAYEAEMLRVCHAIVDWTFDECVAEGRIGMTEADMYRCLFSKLGLYGAERTDRFPVQFGRPPNNYGKPLSTRKLEDGDFVWVDFRGATYGGYPADRGRIARAGTPTDWELEAYRKVRHLTIEVARSLRPGMTCSAAFQRFEELWTSAGVGPLYGAASRIAHGGGLVITEPPSVMRGGTEVIEEGMVIHVEPKLERNGAVIQFEEIVYVGARENEFLNELSPETLPVIGRAS